ncbi:hypothetical protein SDJN02_17162, partial [Cucurbita argyrosperma subsp. argyrosperma]
MDTRTLISVSRLEQLYDNSSGIDCVILKLLPTTASSSLGSSPVPFTDFYASVVSTKTELQKSRRRKFKREREGERGREIP